MKPHRRRHALYVVFIAVALLFMLSAPFILVQYMRRNIGKVYTEPAAPKYDWTQSAPQ